MTPVHACPRCEYDLAGETSRWEAACPVAGRCPECGLDFAWADVLVPSRWRLHGFVEHARGLLQTLSWFWVTFWWLPLPWRFWSRVKLHHTVNLRRVVVTFLILLAVLHVARAGCMGISLWSVGQLAALPPNRMPPPAPPPTWAYFSTSLHPFAVPSPQYTYVPSTRTVTCIGWTLTPLPGWQNPGLLWFAGMAVFWPIMFLALPITRRRASVRWAHIRRATVYPFLVLVPCAAIALIGAVSDAVRGQPPVWLSNSWASWTGWPPVVGASALGWVVKIIFTLSPLWLAVWWFLAINRGWRLPRGIFVWLLLQVAAGLAAAVAFVLFFLLSLHW